MKVIKAKHPLAIRWFHWVNFPVLSLMIWSGLLIYWAHDIYRLGIGQYTFFKFFPEKFYQFLGLGQRLAEGMAWHFAFMWIFAINGLLYVGYTVLSGEWKYLVPSLGSFKEAFQVVLHDLHLYRKPLPVKKFNGAQQIAYTSIVLMGAGSLLTGLSIYKPVQLHWLTSAFGGYETARYLHFYLTMGYVAFFGIHIVQVIKAGWNNFRAMVTGYEIVTEVSTPEEAK